MSMTESGLHLRLPPGRSSRSGLSRKLLGETRYHAAWRRLRYAAGLRARGNAPKNKRHFELL